jgi:anti-sigma B factor antagonist
MKNESGLCQLRLEGEMTIFTAADIRERLLAPLLSCQQLVVDLSQVSELDSAGLQLMVLAKREASSLGKDIHFVEHSSAVLDVLELCELTRYFGDPVVIMKDEQK